MGRLVNGTERLKNNKLLAIKLFNKVHSAYTLEHKRASICE